jgi:uncharacterized protein
MQLIDDELAIAATDLGRFLSCRHLTALDIEVALGRRKKPPAIPDPFLELLQKRGKDHEDLDKKNRNDRGETVLDLTGCVRSEAEWRCVQAMKAGQPAIAQGVLRGEGFLGLPDILVKVARPSDLGPWSYEACDTKLALETRAATILQLCLYSELLERVQGVSPERFHVVTPLRPESYRVAEYAAIYRLVRGKLIEEAREDPAALLAANYPEPVELCDVCRWSYQCNKRRRADDHLSLVAGITRLQRRELEGNGIETLAELGEIRLPFPFKPSRGSVESLERAQRQARIQLEGRQRNELLHELLEPAEAGRGLALLPDPSPGDVFLDLEGDHFAAQGGREYLFGMTILDGAGKISHRHYWAFTESAERAAFETAVDEIMTLWAANPGMHVYHYAPYEPSAFKRLMCRHATRDREVDRMLRAGLFVDLYSVVRQGLRASVESYSIKRLEPFYGFAREAPVEKAAGARRVIELAIEDGDDGLLTPEVRELVRTYNEEDCRSALALRGWLESLRAEHERAGRTVPRPPLQDGSASEEQEARRAEIQAAMDALLEGVPTERSERTDEQQAKWLVAHMLEFHRREEKVSWWEFFHLCGLVDRDELMKEKAVVTGLEFVSRTPPVGRQRVPVDRYTFPVQEFDCWAGDELKTQDQQKWGTIEGIDHAARWIDVKKTKASADVHAVTAFVHNRVPTEPIPGALMRIAQDLIANGVDGKSSAARELLLRRPPRLSSGRFEVRSGESPREFARRAVVVLDRSILPIQGPPGAGKTWTGAHMIVDCVAAGLKVGVSANSHKVIRKLLEDAVKEAGNRSVPLRCVHKGSKDGSLQPGIDEVSANEAALDAIRTRAAEVVSGTAWLWSREDAADLLDVLFVDEAGQTSLANVLAMSLATKNVVLLGDPQQLEQPQRGTHPEGVGGSALEHLLGEHKTMPAERGIFLDRTWRLSPEICEFTSEVFYEGRLESQPTLARQKLSGAPPYEGAGLWFAPVKHDGNVNASAEEVAAVRSIVGVLLANGSQWTDHKGAMKPLTAAQILVVAPFNSQVNLLHASLDPMGVAAGTVDRFQGQEGAVVIYSMATSRPEDAPRGMEFLYDLNRLNVATSRARCACIIVASPRLLEPECRTPRQMRLANALCRYLEYAGETPGRIVRVL